MEIVNDMTKESNFQSCQLHLLPPQPIGRTSHDGKTVSSLLDYLGNYLPTYLDGTRGHGLRRDSPPKTFREIANTVGMPHM